MSDTHSYLDPQVKQHFSGCDEIWHAGDIGSIEVADQLSALKPFRAVYGNIDDSEIRARYPEDLRFEVGGVSILMTHIGGAPPKYNPRVRKLLLEQTPDVFICGHSHILKIGRDAAMKNMLFVNPGAAGQHGFHTMKTIVRFTISGGKVSGMEVIELGKRGLIS